MKRRALISVFYKDGILELASYLNCTRNSISKLVQAWLILHEEELYVAWNKAVQNQPFDKIEPLR
jgi:hypothetical protein